MAGLVKDRAYVLEAVDVHKSFFDNEVLKGVSFGIGKGEVLGLLGSNGAGKSTLMKILSGVYRLDRGQIRLNGEPAVLRDAQDAGRQGIAMVYQEFSLIPTMTVAENLFLGREIKRRGWIDEKACRCKAEEALEEFGIEIDVRQPVEALSIGNQQIVEIVKALMQRPSVLILDEPTASLTNKEIQMLFTFIRRLKQQGISIFLISHHMQEIMEICDRAVVLRNGCVEIDEAIEALSIPIMVEAMIGKKLSNHYLAPKNRAVYEKPLLEVKDLSWADQLNHVSLKIYPGEILGIAGLLGSGRTELLKCIYGLLKPDGGELILNGERVSGMNPCKAVASGLAFIPENRRECGMIGIHSVMYNMLLSIWGRTKRGIFIDEKKARRLSEALREKLAVKCTGIDQETEYLSGGNQQKVVFGKCLASGPKLLLLDDPTVGIDVEAKASIAALIREAADSGSSILMVSSEMEEMERLCDRVLIIGNGTIKRELNRQKGDEITEASLARAVQLG